MKRLIPILILASGCVGTDVGNPQDKNDVDVTITLETDFQTTTQALEAEGFSIIEANATLFAVELSKSCDADESALTQGPFPVGLLNAESIPVETQGPGTYCKATFSFGEANKPLENWLEISGTLPDEREFRIEAKRSEKLNFNGRESFVVDEDGASFNLSFEALNWLKDAALPDENPVIISDNSNAALYNQFRQYFREQSKLYKDTNRDNIIGPDERNPIADPMAN